MKPRRLDGWTTELRRRHAASYTALLDDAVDRTPPVADWVNPVWHLYVIRSAARDRVREALSDANIASGMHYPVPLHLQPALASLGHGPGAFPAAEAWAASALSLPMFPELEAEEASTAGGGDREGCRVSAAPANDAPFRLIADVEFGEGVVVYSFTNLYGCSIGDETRIGAFVEVQRGAVIGKRCKISSHSFVCDGVEIG